MLGNAHVEHYQAIELKLPEELADTGGRRLIAARFTDERSALDAMAALQEQCPSTREAGIFVARLGGTSGVGDPQLLVARLTLSEHFAAERLVADMGGDVVYEANERGPAAPLTGLQLPTQGV